ncbi:MAG: hypothetical protein JWN67_4192 [Actinomycetia bacterium]|nr:hypothetical protein [Actinomycetes bacterium]
MKGIGSAAAFGFQAAVDLGVAEASDYLATEHAEARPGCEDWTSKTNTGSTQRGHFVGEVDIPDIGDDRLATQLRIENEGQSFEATSIEVRVGGQLVTFLLAMPSRLPSEAVVGLAERLGARLDR